MKLAPALVSAVALLAHSAAALACGASAPPYYVLGEQFPEGEGVALNAPIVVELWDSADGPVYETQPEPQLTLTVKDRDEAIELKAQGSVPHLAWVPTAPLAPNTVYEAHFNPGYEGHPDNIWTFTTGSTTTPRIALDGEFSAELIQGVEPIIECPNCNGDCIQTGQRYVTQARITLPLVKDGFSGRTGELWLTDSSPYVFVDPKNDGAAANAAHEVSLSTSVTFFNDGKPTREVLITLPEESQAYYPCFALRVTDDRGDGVAAKSFCLEESFPLSSPKPQPNDGEPVVTDDESSPKTSSSCSFGVVSTSGSSAAFALLGLAALTRRRRSRSAL